MTVYALLVGINEYASDRVRNLNGCVRDVERFKGFLQARVIPSNPDGASPSLSRNDDDGLTDEGGRLKLKILRDDKAKRDDIIREFRAHLGDAQDGDVALFYYSGHGSQEAAPREFWPIEPDRKNETIVCHDSRIDPYSWDLADKELAALIGEISAGKPNLHTLVILDSCHSGSGTRDANEAGVRMTSASSQTRPIESYELDRSAISGGDGANWYKPPDGKHILMAACRPEQLAREQPLEGEVRGVFSHHLLNALTGGGPTLTYRELSKHLSAMVRLLVKDQSPQIEATHENLNQPFLGGQIQPKKTGYTARFDANLNGWVIDGGTIHGIAATTRPETTELALFRTLDSDSGIDLSQAKGAAKVTQVYPTHSKIEGAFDGSPLDRNQTYQAIVTATPLPPLWVTGEGDAAKLAEVETVLDEANSLLVRLAKTTEEIDAAKLRLVALADAGVYRISRISDEKSRVVDTAFAEPDSARLVVDRLAHIARWLTSYELANSQSYIPDNAVTLEATIVEGASERVFNEGGDLRLSYVRLGDQWRAPRLRFKLINRSEQTFYSALINLTPDYRIWAASSRTHQMMIHLDPGAEAGVLGGGRIKLVIDDELWQQGVTEQTELFKLIVSTNEFDAGLLEQPKLPVRVEPPTKDVKDAKTRGGDVFKSLSQKNTLNRLMVRIPHRGEVDDEDIIFTDWRTVDLSVTVYRPQEASTVEAGKSVDLGQGICLINDSDLTADASLMSDPDASRDLGSLALPDWLREDPPRHIQPFALATTRDVGQPGLSVLALDNVENYEAVTPESPLKLRAPVALGQQEHVLPVGFDGEFYLPLGRVSSRGEKVEITLERLPAPEPTKGLANSIRIYFQKVASDVTGVTYDYPRLAHVTYDEPAKTVVYNSDPAQVRAAISSTDKVLLYIHGIIGETKYATPSAWEEVNGRRLADRYDCILAFDYENLNTGIEKTARQLRDKLAEAGLGPDSSKTLHVVAHSMGGLIARWMIEDKNIEGGREMVQQLFMFGTPNGGSPWPKIQDWATMALSLGLNSLLPATWPVTVIGGLLKMTETIDKNLDEMAVGSKILDDLASRPDPGVPYTIVAGNTSIKSVALESDPNGEEKVIKRLATRLFSKETMHNVGDLAFFNQPNDVAVAVDSIKKVTDSRSPQPQKREVACDHFGYFTTDAGLQTLVETVLGVEK